MNSNSRLATSNSKTDGGWGWVIVCTTFIIHLICDGVMFTFGIFYAEFLEYFQTTASKASLVMSVFIGVSYCIGPTASGLIRKFGNRGVSMVGTVISCLGMLLSVVVPEIEYLYLTIGIIAGIGFGLIYLPSIISVPLCFEKHRATAMGISTAGSGIGSLVFAPLTEWLIAYYCTWKGAMLIGTGLVLNCLFLSLFYRESGKILKVNGIEETPFDNQVSSDFYEIQDPTTSNNSDSMQQVENLDINITDAIEVSRIASAASLILVSNSESAAKVSCFGFKETLKELMDLTLFKNYVFCIFSVFTFLYYFGISSPTVYLFHLATNQKIATKSEASFLLSIMGIANTIGKIVFGLWADKASVSVLTICIICLFANGISTMMISLITEYYQIALYSLVFGVTWGATVSLTSILLVDLLGLDKLSNAYGLYLLVTGISTSAGAPVTGILYDITGSYNLGFYLAGGFTIVGTLLLLIIPSVQRRFPQ